MYLPLSFGVSVWQTEYLSGPREDVYKLGAYFKWCGKERFLNELAFSLNWASERGSSMEWLRVRERRRLRRFNRTAQLSFLSRISSIAIMAVRTILFAFFPSVGSSRIITISMFNPERGRDF